MLKCGMVRLSQRDYADSGLSVRRAFVEAHRAYDGPLIESTEPMSIVWGGREITVGDKIPAPAAGRFQLTFLSGRPEWRQGVDIEAPGGGITLSDGEVVSALRTWCPPESEPIFEYEYRSPKELLHVSTVYEASRGNQTVVERWTGNAAMYVEHSRAAMPEGVVDQYVYHCSHADSSPPNFADLVFSLTLRTLAA
jgi:hypothetical protein